MPTESHNTIMAAYRTFEAGGTNNNAFALMQTALQSIDSAVMQGLVSGGDVTGLVALRSQMESGLSENVRQSVFGSNTVNTKAMVDAVALLMKLPAEVQGTIGADALSQAYFDFLTAGKKGKTAAQAKAVEALFASAEAAIASGKLDAAAVQELKGLLAEIDRERGVGDNITDIIAAKNANKGESEVVESQQLANIIAQEYNAKYNPAERAKIKGYEGIGTTANGGVTFEGTKYMYPVEEGQLNRVTIQAQGTRTGDFNMAISIAGLSATPDYAVWDHLDEYNVETGEMTLELVYKDAHRATVPHAGGCAQYDAVHGPSYNK